MGESFETKQVKKQDCKMPKTNDFAARLVVFSSQKQQLESVWLWASYLMGDGRH